MIMSNVDKISQPELKYFTKRR